MPTQVGLGAQAEIIRKLNVALGSCSVESIKLAIAQSTLSKSQIKAILSNKGLKGQLLETTAAELAQMTATNANVASQTAATGASNGFSLALKGLASSIGIVKFALGSVAVLLTATYFAFSKYKQHLEDIRQSSEEEANIHKQNTASIQEYISKYKELHSSLILAKGSETETYTIKKQLLQLQTELNEKFGDEYGKLNLVTNAYKDQTDAIKALTKESANTFLNENQEGINNAEKELYAKKTYDLSYAVPRTPENEKNLFDIVNKYKNSGMSILDAGESFYIKLDANPKDAYETINSFMTDVQNKAKELGNENLFKSDILGISSDSLNKTKETIDKNSEIVNQAGIARIQSNPKLSKKYEEAIFSVNAYHEAVLKSNDIYSDEVVEKTWNNLQSVKNELKNDSDWNQFSVIVNDIFSSANDNVYSFYQALKDDKTISNLANDLKGLSDIDLLSMSTDGNNSDTFDKLCEEAEKYQLEAQEVIDLMTKLGYIYSKIINEIKENPLPFSDQFKDLWDSESFEDARKDLAKLSKESGITEADILSLTRENETLASLLNESGISAQFAATCFNKVCDGTDGFSAITDDAIALDKVLHEMDSSLEKVTASKSAYDKAMEADDYNAGFKDYQEAYSEAMEMFEDGEYGKHFYSAMEYLLGDDSYTMSIEEMYESMKSLKSIFGKDGTNGLEFLDRLYEKKEVLDGLNSSLQKDADGKYEYDFKPEEFETIADSMGMTTEAVTACVHALGMFGDHAVYDIDKVNGVLKEMSVSAKNGKESFMSLQGISTMLSDLGYNGKEISSIIEDIKGMEGITLLDFSLEGESTLAGIVSQLKELEMIEFDGNAINAESLIQNLHETFNMAYDDIEAFMGKFGNNTVFTDAQGRIITLKEAIDKFQQSDDSTAADCIKNVGDNVEDTNEKVNKLNEASLSGVRDEFRIFGLGIDDAGKKLDGFLVKAGTLGNTKISLPSSTPSTNQGVSKSQGGSTPKKGAAKASGSMGIKKDETALINELGNETIIDPKNGKYEVVEGGAQFRRLKKGQIILNHLQTKALFKNGKIASFGRMMFGGSAKMEGNSYAEGTIPSKNPATGKAWGSKKKDSSKKKSDADSSKEPSIETFNFIEIAISRIEAAIDRLKDKAGQAFNTFTSRGKAYSQAISKITEEINIQSQAYNAYMARANSVNLEGNYAAQVRDGSINIEDIADDGLKDRIKKYQEWWVTPPCPVMGKQNSI